MTELDLLSSDPVRPHIPKLDVGKQVYVLDDKSAVICVCYCTQVPETEQELEQYKSDTGSVLVAYTYVGDASKIHRIYKEEIEDKFKNPELLNVVVHQKFGGSFQMFQSWMQSNRLFLSIYG